MDGWGGGAKVESQKNEKTAKDEKEKKLFFFFKPRTESDFYFFCSCE